MKDKLLGNTTKSLAIVVVCLSLIFTVTILNVMTKEKTVETEVPLAVETGNFSEADFPLDGELSSVVFSVGDKLSGTATITNCCGKNVHVVSNGYMPCAYLHSSSDTKQHPELDSRWEGHLRTNTKLSNGFVYELTEPGTYVLYVHYYLEVNGVVLKSELEDIIIEVK